MYIKNCSVTKLYYWAVIYPAVSSDFDAIWDFKMNYLMKLSNFTCCMCTSELISPHFIQLVLLGWKEVTAVLFLICALVKFASFATVKDSWKLLMLSCPSVRVWFIHLKLPELRWVKPWRCLLITVIMMQLKKRKQKERKGLSLREIRVQLNKSGPTKSVSLSLTLWTLWAVCFPASRWELWANGNTVRQSYFTKAWAEVHKERKCKEAVSILCILIFAVQ